MDLNYRRITKYGNPFKICVVVPTAERAVQMYRDYLDQYPLSEEEITELSKADYLACFCPLDTCCHVDVIIEKLINQ